MLSSRTVYVIDDDREARISLHMVLRSAEIRGRPFGSASDFLESLPDLTPGCLIVDLRMPSMDGIGLLVELERRGIDWPAIIVTGDPDVSAAVAALRLGVVDLLEKPYDQTELLDAIERCFLRCQARYFAVEGQDRIAALTPRERDALDGVMRGETSKHSARRLNLSPRTVEMHRARMMRKLGVKTASGIVAVAATAGYRVDHLLG